MTVEERSKEMQNLISKTLAYGVIVSTVILFIGVVLMVAEGTTGYQCDLSSLSCLLHYNGTSIPHGDYPNTIQSLVSGVIQLKPFAVIELGIVALLATPVFRVGMSVLVFAVEKDRIFVIITLVVLAALLFSFFAVPFIPIFRA